MWKKNSHIRKFLIHSYQAHFMIGLRNDQITILTNHMWCLKASSAQGVIKIRSCVETLVSPQRVTFYTGKVDLKWYPLFKFCHF